MTLGIVLLSVIGTVVWAKEKTVLGKVFEKVVLHGVDKALDDLDKGEESSILKYYKIMGTKTVSVDAKEELTSKLSNNINRVESSFNGITLIAKYPKEVKKGKKFKIVVKMINDIKDASMGGLTLSFPQYASLEGAIIDYKFDSVKGYTPPKKMYSSSLKKSIKIHYFVIEGWENKWVQDSSRFMTIELIAPKDNDEFEINLRGVLIIGKKSSKYEITNPTNKNALLTDQQGFYVKKIKIKLED